MKIFGKSLSEYVKFDRVFLILVLVVGLARLGLSLAGVPNATAKYLSLTVVFLLAMLYYSVTVHTSGFGSYRQLLPVLALPVILGNCVIIAGIAISMAAGKDNIFSAPEYSAGKASGRTLGHIGGHVVATIVLPLIMWAIGSLIMFVTKKVTGSRQPSGSVAGA
jgi:hypothetical protein